MSKAKNGNMGVIERDEDAEGRLVLPAGSCRFLRKVTFAVKQLESLKVDTEYQRTQIKDQAVEICRALEAGGMIPEPIWVSDRGKDGLYIVDGQQRWNGHVLASKPITAEVYWVKDRVTEALIFHILNNRKRMHSAHMALTWPYQGGGLLRWMHEDVSSPCRDRIGFKTNDRMPASTVAKAVLACLTGRVEDYSIQEVMRRLDEQVAKDPVRAQKVAQMFGAVLVQLFDGKHIPSLPTRVFGGQCYEDWCDLKVRDAWPMPTKVCASTLRRVNWQEVVPSNSNRFVPTVKQYIAKRWKVA